MDHPSNRDLSQPPDDELTPAEREELKRRLDSFVEVMRRGVFDGRRVTPRARAVRTWDPAGRDGKG